MDNPQPQQDNLNSFIDNGFFKIFDKKVFNDEEIKQLKQTFNSPLVRSFLTSLIQEALPDLFTLEFERDEAQLKLVAKFNRAKGMMSVINQLLRLGER